MSTQLQYTLGRLSSKQMFSIYNNNKFHIMRYKSTIIASVLLYLFTKQPH